MKTIITLLFVGSSSFFFSQSTINASGSDASGTNGNVSSSIGQVFYESSGSLSGTVIPGVQQSYEILETLGMDIKEIGLNMKIYPNPTADVLNLSIAFNDYKSYSFELIDNSARLLITGNVKNANTSLLMTVYPAGIYILKVKKGGKLIKSFKVIKSDK